MLWETLYEGKTVIQDENHHLSKIFRCLEKQTMVSAWLFLTGHSMKASETEANVKVIVAFQDICSESRLKWSMLVFLPELQTN